LLRLNPQASQLLIKKFHSKYSSIPLLTSLSVVSSHIIAFTLQ